VCVLLLLICLAPKPGLVGTVEEKKGGRRAQEISGLKLESTDLARKERGFFFVLLSRNANFSGKVKMRDQVSRVSALFACL
jgi:hypothetical protein